jgi:hypothetical protein
MIFCEQKIANHDRTHSQRFESVKINSFGDCYDRDLVWDSGYWLEGTFT